MRTFKGCRPCTSGEMRDCSHRGRSRQRRLCCSGSRSPARYDRAGTRSAMAMVGSCCVSPVTFSELLSAGSDHRHPPTRECFSGWDGSAACCRGIVRRYPHGWPVADRSFFRLRTFRSSRREISPSRTATICRHLIRQMPRPSQGDIRRAPVSSEQSLDGKLFVQSVAPNYPSCIKKQVKGLIKTCTLPDLLDRLDIIEWFEYPGG